MPKTPRAAASRKAPRRTSRARKPKSAARPAPTPAEEEPLAPALAVPEVAPPPPADVPISAPEAAFAARLPPPEPERPRPTARRAIFFDVENTSRPSDVGKMLDLLGIDRASRTTELVASGNWRVIGNETARLLAARGAHLVHSAPATGVRDWSDLRIALSAGVWLASARAGDELDIVSDDKAFDAAGDVASALGVVFHRYSFRAAAKAARSGATEKAAASEGTTRGGRRRRGGGRRAPAQAAAPASAPEEPTSPAPSAPAAAEAPHPAPHGDVLQVVKDLLAASPGGVTLDGVANRLRALGFQRPPGSPRLVTRLRAFKDLDVSPGGMIRLRGEAGGAEGSAAEPAPEAGGEAAEGGGGDRPPGASRRRRRRGGRRRSGGAARAAGEP